MKYNKTRSFDDRGKKEFIKEVKNELRSSFAINLRECIDNKGVSLSEISQKVQSSKASLSDYINGKSDPSMQTVNDLANYFEVTTDYLLGRTPIKKPNYDNIAIEKRLGLSEQAIKKLEEIAKFCSDSEDTRIIETVNELFTNVNCSKIFGAISRFLFPDKYVNNILGGWTAKAMTTKGPHLISAENLNMAFTRSTIPEINEMLFALKSDIDGRHR